MIVAAKRPASDFHDVFDPSDRTRLDRQGRRSFAKPMSANALDAATRAQHDWDALKGNARADDSGTRGRSVRDEQRASDGARCARSRQDAAERARRSARGGRSSCAITRRRRARSSRTPIALPGPDGRIQRAVAARPRRRSSASRRGISRSRSSPARSPVRSPPATPCSAKPAEQTPLIAAAAVRLLHQAGVPVDALHLLPGRRLEDRQDRVRRHTARRRRLHRIDGDRDHDQPRARGARRRDRRPSSPRPAARTR